MGHKLRRFIGISPPWVSNPYDGEICHSSRRSYHSATEQGQVLLVLPQYYHIIIPIRRLVTFTIAMRNCLRFIFIILKVHWLNTRQTQTNLHRNIYIRTQPYNCLFLYKYVKQPCWVLFLTADMRQVLDPGVLDCVNNAGTWVPK